MAVDISSVSDGNSSYLQEMRKMQAEDRQFQKDLTEVKRVFDKDQSVFQLGLTMSEKLVGR